MWVTHDYRGENATRWINLDAVTTMRWQVLSEDDNPWKGNYGVAFVVLKDRELTITFRDEEEYTQTMKEWARAIQWAKNNER